jgi:para-nitrobenzyl esterase
MAAFGLVWLLTFMSPLPAADLSRVRTTYGTVEGMDSPRSGVRVFLGIPFAAPPIGPWRWKPPRAPERWTGVRRAESFGPRCMQEAVFADTVFRSHRMSEDCLYLNIWAPDPLTVGRHPVLVYFHGGGFVAGDGSEPKFDGESMARRGIVVVTLNYRLGVFGFLAHPELSRESTYGGSGNYGLLDQAAALSWVHENIAAFGGDPRRVTIGGVSAGSVSVSALMASPLSRGLVSGAIGESGSILGTLPALPLAVAEADGKQFAVQAGAASLAGLRALSAERLLALAGQFGAFRYNPPTVRFTPTVDGYFLPKAPAEIFAAGEQAHVPLLAGSNSEEMPPAAVLGDAAPTIEGYRSAVEKLYGTQAEAVIRAYHAAGPGEDVLDAAQALASDRFTGYSTWKWIELVTRTGGKPTFYYLFSRSRPMPNPEPDATSGAPAVNGGATKSPQARTRGALHAAEIEYVLGNLERSPMYAWTADDHLVSETAQSYFANFIESGDPNTGSLPPWPAYAAQERMILDVRPRVQPDGAAARGELFDALLSPSR